MSDMSRKCAVVYWCYSRPVPGFTRVRAVSLDDIKQPPGETGLHERRVYQVRFRKPNMYLPGLLMEIQDDMLLDDLIRELYNVERRYELRGERWAKELNLHQENVPIRDINASSSESVVCHRRTKVRLPPTRAFLAAMDRNSPDMYPDPATWQPATRLTARKSVVRPLRRPDSTSPTRQHTKSERVSSSPPTPRLQKRLASSELPFKTTTRQMRFSSVQPNVSKFDGSSRDTSRYRGFRVTTATAARDISEVTEGKRSRGRRPRGSLTVNNQEIPESFTSSLTGDLEVIRSADLLKHMITLKTWGEAFRYVIRRLFPVDEILTYSFFNRHEMPGICGLVGRACDIHEKDEDGRGWVKPSHQQLASCLKNLKAKLKKNNANKSLSDSD